MCLAQGHISMNEEDINLKLKQFSIYRRLTVKPGTEPMTQINYDVWEHFESKDSLIDALQLIDYCRSCIQYERTIREFKIEVCN